MENMTLYIKKNRRYYPVEGDIGMPANGIWLVQDVEHGHSKRCILRGDIPELDTVQYIRMQADFHDDLCRYIYLRYNSQIIDTYKVNADGSVSWRLGSNYEFANDIIAFLSLDKDIRKRYIKNLEDKWTLHGNGDTVEIINHSTHRPIAVIHKDGAVISIDTKKFDKEYLLKEKKTHETRLNIVNKLLNEHS
jgi:hypothetical protein